MTWLRTAWQAGAVRLLVSRNSAAELLRVLAYAKFALTQADRDELLADYLPWCDAVTIPGAAPRSSPSAAIRSTVRSWN